jgi:hypothetical protein
VNEFRGECVVWVCVVCLFVGVGRQAGGRERNPMQTVTFSAFLATPSLRMTVDFLSGFACHFFLLLLHINLSRFLSVKEIMPRCISFFEGWLLV